MRTVGTIVGVKPDKYVVRILGVLNVTTSKKGVRRLKKGAKVIIENGRVISVSRDIDMCHGQDLKFTEADLRMMEILLNDNHCQYQKILDGHINN